MKGSLGPTIFINRIEHIMTHLKLFKGNLHREDFKDILNVKYSKYTARANEKGIVFELSKKEFNEKIKEDCYLCGKKTTDYHKNGLDRVDNDKGYTEINIKSCCGNCNMLKINYTYESLIEKCKLICDKNIELQEVVSKTKSKVIIKSKKIKMEDKVIQNKEDQDISRNTPSNKLSIEEKREKERIKKQLQREKLRQKYGDEEYKKMRVKEIVENRKRIK
jgi:hypothetical protein